MSEDQPVTYQAEYLIFPPGMPTAEQTKFMEMIRRRRMNKLSIYLAGKLDCAEVFHGLKEQWPEFDLVASWVELFAIHGATDTWQAAAEGWPINIQQAAGADVVLIWGRDNQALRGALVEVGAALGRGKTILLVGESESFGTWRFHPSCFLVEDLLEARAWLNRFAAKRALEEVA